MRRQITLPPDVDARLNELATGRGTSRSEVIADAIRTLPDPGSQLDRLLAFRGVVTGGEGESWGRDIDGVVYRDPHLA